MSKLLPAFLSLLFFLPFQSIYSAVPVQKAALEEVEELEEEETQASQDTLFNDEEEISALPKKGGRPQVIQIPTKTSPSR